MEDISLLLLTSSQRDFNIDLLSFGWGIVFALFVSWLFERRD